MISLRPYQREAIDSVWQYLNSNPGNCLASISTGGGKSICMGTFVKEACEMYPGTRVMMLAHIKELLSQNCKALLSVWPEAPVGLWSAGLGQKVKHQITIAGIQSVHKLPAKFAPVDLVVIDECHLIPKSGNGMYLKFINELRRYNPNMRVVGWTATPFRTDTGLLTEGKDKLFDDVAYETNVGDMIKDGWLCPIVARGGATKADLTGVHTRGGDFVPSELQHAMDKNELIDGALDEIQSYAHDRKSILAFCSGVEHAAHVAEAARQRGWSAGYVSGDMPNTQRDQIIADFKAGRIRFLTNANILTVGFDHPAVDCIVLLRPTKSAGLYLQIVGRGLRKHQSKENTLLLDFTDTVARFGPIDQLRIKSKREKNEATISVSPIKECPGCHEFVHPSVVLCPTCEYEWPVKAAHGIEAADAVIVAALEQPRAYAVTDVSYSRHAKMGKPDSIRVMYFCGVNSFSEWLPINDERPNVRKHYVSWCWKRGLIAVDTIEQFLDLVSQSRVPAPASVVVKPDGKYWRIVDTYFNWDREVAA